MIQNKEKSETSSKEYFPNDNKSKNSSNKYFNQIESKGKKENDQLNNSITSNSSNKDGYSNFISKLKLNYHLKYPQNRTQTIILHTSLDKSYSDLNDSLNQNEINNDQKLDDLLKNPELNNTNNYTGNELDQELNNGFLLDNSVLNNQNNNNIKRKAINYLNELYEEEKRQKTNNKKSLDKNEESILSEKAQKENLTINFNNNMFFVNDSNNNKQNSFPIKNLYNDLKKKSGNSFKDKVFMSNNDFDNTFQGLQNEEKNEKGLLPYGFQNNPFLTKNTNKDNENNSFQQIKLKQSDNIYDNSSLNNLSTNFNTNNTNNKCNDDQNNNHNKGISPFNIGENNTSVNSFQNLGNSLSEPNNNRKVFENKKVGNSNLQFSFNPLNYPNNKGDEHDINCTSKIFHEKNPFQDNTINNQNYPNNQEQEIKNNDYFNEKDPNNNEIDNESSDPKFIELKNPYPAELDNDLNTDTFAQKQNNEYNKDGENNLNPNQNIDPSLNINKPYNTLNNLNNFAYIENPNNFDYILIVNPKGSNRNNDINNNQEIIIQNNEDKSLRTSLSDNEVLENEGNSKEKGNLLKSLLYGLLLGSTVTGLFWLRNEETRKHFLEKYNKINFDSIINSFKNILNPEFFQEKFSKEKRDVYSKVIGLSLVKFYDFFEKYGDGFRLIGIFLFIYTIWLIIKSLIKASIKTKNLHN